MFVPLLFSAFLLAFSSGATFDVIWNVPSRQCRQYGFKFENLLRQYDITVNDEDAFQGQNMTIFYESQLGLYPKILKNGTDVNGGTPQLGDLNAHLEKAAKDIQATDSNRTSSGLRVIDWEAWRPVWEFNWDPMRIYQTRSKDLVRKKQPDLTAADVVKAAQKQWENSAKEWMLKTLELAKKLRPNSVWCYYLFPDCYNYQGNSPEQLQCSKNVKKGNDKLKWLWEASTAICPSLYMYESQLLKFSAQQRAWFTNGRLVEAIRVAKEDSVVYPYINYSLRPGHMVPKEEFWRIMAQVASLGLKGTVIWGSSASVASKELCQGLLDYIVETLGPASEKIAWNFRRCSEQVCGGKGACTWPSDSLITAWKLLASDKDHVFYAGDITCKCMKGYEGNFCQKVKISDTESQ